MNTIKKFLADETGLELTEYAIAAAIIVAGLIALFTDIGGLIKNKVTAIKNELTPPSAS